MKNFALIVSGNGGFARMVYYNRHLIYTGNLALVLSDRECGATEFFQSSSKIPCVILDRAKHGMDYFEEQARVELEKRNVHAVFLTFDRLISRNLFDFPPGGTYNLHLSLLPAFLGFHAVEKSYNAGCLFYGATVHKVDESVDEGPILYQVAVARGANETLEEHTDYIYRSACRILLESILAVCGNLVREAGGRIWVEQRSYGQFPVNPEPILPAEQISY